MKPDKNRQFNESAILNNASYLLYQDRFRELAQSTFAYDNLPETIDVRCMERVLMEEGQICFFRDEDFGFLALPFTLNGFLNVYGEPVTIRAYSGYNGYQRVLTVDEDAVIIYNNVIKKPTLPVISYYSQILWDIDRSISVNTRAQKTPVLIKTDEKGRLSLLNLYKKYDGNEPVIFGRNDLDISQFTVLKTDAPFTGEKLFALKQMYYSEMLAYLGITSSINKRERLLTDEMQRSQGSVIANRYSRFSTRETAVRKINALFNLDVEVFFRDTGLLDYYAQDSITNETNDERFIPVLS